MSEWKLVPVDPVADQSDKLARDIIMWWSMSPPTGAALYLHLTRLGRDIPAWLPTMVRDAVYVPPKGVVAMAVYRAMIDAAPVPVGDDCDDILDCYAAESQQFSDEIVSLRASVESARTKAIALESRRDAWRDSAILSQRSASELARQVDQQAAELARLRAEVASLTAQLQSGESFHAVAVRQRDAAWREVEALKATMTQQCKGFRADVEKLEAEVEALRADAERWEHARSIACFTEDRDMGPGGWWTVAVYVKRRPAANTIDAAVDAARAAQGDST